MLALRDARPTLILLSATLAWAAPVQADLRSRLLALVPDTTQAAEILKWGVDPEIVVIRERITQAVRQDPAWFRDYSDLFPGRTPPYHPKFGVSEGEYRRLLTESGVRLLKTGGAARVTVTVTSTRVTFQGGTNGAEVLKGITLNLTTGELRVPEGFTAKPHSVSVNGQNDNVGLPSRTGWGWSIVGTNAQTKTVVRANLSLLQLETGEVLLAYNRASSVNHKPQPEVDLNLLYTKRNPSVKR